jgi:hypothetical protein
MTDPSLFLVIIRSKRGVGELFSTTVAEVTGNEAAIGFSKEGAVSDEESFFWT